MTKVTPELISLYRMAAETGSMLQHSNMWFERIEDDDVAVEKFNELLEEAINNIYKMQELGHKINPNVKAKE